MMTSTKELTRQIIHGKLAEAKLADRLRQRWEGAADELAIAAKQLGDAADMARWAVDDFVRALRDKGK